MPPPHLRGTSQRGRIIMVRTYWALQGSPSQVQRPAGHAAIESGIGKPPGEPRGGGQVIMMHTACGVQWVLGGDRSCRGGVRAPGVCATARAIRPRPAMARVMAAEALCGAARVRSTRCLGHMVARRAGPALPRPHQALLHVHVDLDQGAGQAHQIPHRRAIAAASIASRPRRRSRRMHCTVHGRHQSCGRACGMGHHAHSSSSLFRLSHRPQASQLAVRLDPPPADRSNSCSSSRSQPAADRARLQHMESDLCTCNSPIQQGSSLTAVWTVWGWIPHLIEAE
jgi:hypothetical protein